MRPYSQDWREWLLRAVQAQEESQAASAQRFAVSRSFVERLWQRWRQTGRCAAFPHAGGRRRSLRAAERLIRQSDTAAFRSRWTPTGTLFLGAIGKPSISSMGSKMQPSATQTQPPP